MKKEGTFFLIYFAGHGTKCRGNWLFKRGRYESSYIALQDILQLWRKSGTYSHRQLQLLADCCFSGNWVYSLRRYHQRSEYLNVQMLASSRKNQTCKYDAKHGHGGAFTIALVKKKQYCGFFTATKCCDMARRMAHKH